MGPYGSLVAIMSLCILAGCANAGRVPQGNAEFQSGYLDGCASGRYDANSAHALNTGRGSDTMRYRSEADYRAGWDDGHVACYHDEQRHPAMINGT